MIKNSWTKERVDLVKSLINKGANTQAIAIQLNISRQAVHQNIRKHELLNQAWFNRAKTKPIVVQKKEATIYKRYNMLAEDYNLLNPEQKSGLTYKIFNIF